MEFLKLKRNKNVFRKTETGPNPCVCVVCTLRLSADWTERYCLHSQSYNELFRFRCVSRIRFSMNTIRSDGRWAVTLTAIYLWTLPWSLLSLTAWELSVANSHSYHIWFRSACTLRFLLRLFILFMHIIFPLALSISGHLFLIRSDSSVRLAWVVTKRRRISLYLVVCMAQSMLAAASLMGAIARSRACKKWSKADRAVERNADYAFKNPKKRTNEEITLEICTPTLFVLTPILLDTLAHDKYLFCSSLFAFYYYVK